jgi:hypothetical protein
MDPLSQGENVKTQCRSSLRLQQKLTQRLHFLHSQGPRRVCSRTRRNVSESPEPSSEVWSLPASAPNQASQGASDRGGWGTTVNNAHLRNPIHSRSQPSHTFLSDNRHIPARRHVGQIRKGDDQDNSRHRGCRERQRRRRHPPQCRRGADQGRWAQRVPRGECRAIGGVAGQRTDGRCDRRTSSSCRATRCAPRCSPRARCLVSRSSSRRGSPMTGVRAATTSPRVYLRWPSTVLWWPLLWATSSSACCRSCSRAAPA